MSLLTQQSSSSLADGQPVLNKAGHETNSAVVVSQSIEISCRSKVFTFQKVTASHGAATATNQGSLPQKVEIVFDGTNNVIKFGGNGEVKLDRLDASSYEPPLSRDQTVNGMTVTVDSAWTAAKEFSNHEDISQHVYQNGNLFGEASSVVY